MMHISAMSYYLPDQGYDVSRLFYEGEITQLEEKIFKKMIGTVHVARAELITPSDQVLLLLKKFFAQNIVKVSSIKYIFYAHTADDCAVQSRRIFSEDFLKHFAKNVLCYGVSSHKCASVFQLMVLCKTLFTHLTTDDAIFFIVSDVSFTTVLKQIPGSALMGEGAVALLLKKTGPSHDILDIHLNEYGKFSHKNASGNGPLFQSSYVNNMADVILTCVTRNALSLSDISYIFPHNVNILSWKQVAGVLNIPLNKIYLNNIKNRGHCFGADPLINVMDAIQDNVLKKGDFYLLVTVGLGATFAAALVRY
jgi:3-oxoacyl-[acyl-carrier-protein] synthase-3